MQYPELNIGEFARRHAADIELEKGNDEGYFLMVNVEPGGDGERYPVNIGARPDSVEQLGDLYREQFSDFPSSDLVTIYGNDETAMRSLVGRDTWARIENPRKELEQYQSVVSESVPEAREDIEELDDPDYERILELERQQRDRTGLTLYLKEKIEEEAEETEYEPSGWALDIEPLINGMNDRSYEDVIERIAMATLYTVNRAETGENFGERQQDYHYEIIRSLEPGAEVGPIVVEVGEETSEETIDEDLGTGSESQTMEADTVEFIPSEEESDQTESSLDSDEIDEILSESIDSAKDEIEEREEELTEEDWESLLEAERNRENRVTFTPYLEERLEEEREE